MSIPADDIVKVLPGVLSAGGAALDLNGVILTNSTAVPVGTIAPFPSATAVGNFFGFTSAEYAAAVVYFLGFDNSTKKPGNLIFVQYPNAAVAAYLRSGSLAGMTIAQLQAIPAGVLTVTIDGVLKTSTSINLSGAASFSAAAALINTAIGAGTTTYDPLRAAFVVTSGSVGGGSAITFAAGAIATALLLTQATGAVISNGAAAATPATAMAAIVNLTRNWAAFSSIFEPVLADKTAFSAWANGQNKRFAYVGWDTDANATQPGSTTTWAAAIKAGNYDGSIPVYLSADKAFFALGAIASIDFARTNGRITLAFKGQAGLTPDVTDETTAATLTANGYNYYGQYATNNQTFNFLMNGQISGEFNWVDEYVNQIWLNAQLQLALMILITTVTSIPYNPDGYTMIDAACIDPITAALNFGAIRANVPLSALQIAEVNNQAGATIDTTLSTRGWYLQILPATPQVRAARGTPPCTFWYMDGGAVQNIQLASFAVA